MEETIEQHSYLPVVLTAACMMCAIFSLPEGFLSVLSNASIPAVDIAQGQAGIFEFKDRFIVKL